MIEFEVRGKLYRAERLNVFQQGDMVRKLAPLLPPLVPIIIRLSRQGSLMANLDGIESLLQPFTEALANLPEESFRAPMTTPLSVVRRASEAGDSWAAVLNRGPNLVMFDDMDFGVVLQLALKVFEDSLGPFFREWLTSETAGMALA